MYMCGEGMCTGMLRRQRWSTESVTLDLELQETLSYSASFVRAVWALNH